ncbi:uncharacterized protein LOC132312021 isoform X2 [Cornus florida]|nr:uncharacterized protein LOC132312021 isoform X2 [Cornus florida]
MSFQNNSFWMAQDAGCVTDGDMGYNTSSRIELKRSLVDASEPELFCNKKQAIEAIDSGPMSGISNVNVSLWEKTSNFQTFPAQFTNHLFGSEPIRNFNPVGRNISSLGTGNLNLERKGFENQFGNESSIGLSLWNTKKDPSSCLNYAGIGEVKVNHVGYYNNEMHVPMGHPYTRVDNNNEMHVPMGHPYTRGDTNTISVDTTYNRSAYNISSGPTYYNGDESTISTGPAFTKAGDNFISTGHAFNNRDGNFMLMDHNYNKGSNSVLAMVQPFDKRDGNFISTGQRHEKRHDNITSTGPAHSKGDENFILMGPSNNKDDENFISLGPSYAKGNNNVISMGPIPDGDSNMLLGQNYNEGESGTMSFGGFQDQPGRNPAVRIINSCDLLPSQASAQTSEAAGHKVSVECNDDPIASVTPAAISRKNTISKNKEKKMPKKVPSNNFPSNVKSLLSTGMFDGVPVKYVSWSREKNVVGVIKGNSYLCGCRDCKYSKALNAFEFEGHAGCKTKHPNNRVYFENGKTIYQVVQELKNTPQDKLFEVIQNVTGSPINQKNFNIWQASFKAATRELQRIFGKDEVKTPA